MAGSYLFACYHFRMIRRYLPKSTEELIHWYERYISPFALIAGFLLDSFVLLDRVDVLFGNLLLLSYLVLAGTGIIVLNIVEAGFLRGKFWVWLAPFMPVLIQFFFGALFSGYVSLYSRSAGAAFSWAFVIVLAALLIGNERFRARYLKLPFQLSIYFTTLYSFFIFFLPLVFRAIGPHIFLLAGAVSIVIVSLIIFLLRSLIPDRVRDSYAQTVRSLTIIIIVFNIAYFSNLIPPLPLAMKEGAVVHGLERIGDSYRAFREAQPWYVRMLGYPATFHRAGGENAYVFTSVFAPTGLSTVIRHEWQFYDQSERMWVTRADVRFTIHGGRDGGFRGYSEKSDLQDGSWRVNVLTEHGQIIGRTRFRVMQASSTTPLQEYIR